MCACNIDQNECCYHISSKYLLLTIKDRDMLKRFIIFLIKGSTYFKRRVKTKVPG